MGTWTIDKAGGTRRSPVVRLAGALALAVAVVSGIGAGAAEAAPRLCFGRPATIVGTGRADRLRGTPRADVILGLGGNDRIDALAGNDLICAGDGNDVVLGGAGNDRLDAGRGTDTANAGTGVDACAYAERRTSCERLLYQSLAVAAGRTLRVDADRLEVSGSLSVPVGASIVGTKDVLVVVARGNLNLAGTIRSAGHVVLVSHPSLVPSRSVLDDPSDETAVGVSDGRTPPSDARPVDWNLTGNLETPATAGAASAAPGAQAIRGSRGRSGWTSRLEVYGRLTLGTNGSAAPTTVTVQDGRKGATLNGCNVIGGKGGTGGNLILRATELRLGNVTFSGGNGGNGGDANGADCADGSVNTGGDGGRPGIFAITTMGPIPGGRFTVTGTVTVSGWNAGHGGDATITGESGRPGASVTGIGGDGGEVLHRDSLGRTRGYRMNFGNVTFDGGAWIFNMGRGGDGGDGHATGGAGENGTLCDPMVTNDGEVIPNAVPNNPGGHGGNGGDGTGIGGKGGDVQVTVTGPSPYVLIPGSFDAGDGGDGTGLGGPGGNGANCHCQGGNGGNGGNGAATAGAGGITTFPTAFNGVPGSATASGGGPGQGGTGMFGNGANGNAGAP